METWAREGRKTTGEKKSEWIKNTEAARAQNQFSKKKKRVQWGEPGTRGPIAIGGQNRDSDKKTGMYAFGVPLVLGRGLCSSRENLAPLFID